MPSTPIPVIIVGFRNPSDVCRCLSALAEARPEPAFEPFICENGGSQAYDALVSALSGAGGPCQGPRVVVDPPGQAFLRACKVKLAGSIEVTIGEARGNLGYAGGINAWIEVLLKRPGWPGLWILNPDTVADPDALAELVDYAQKFDKGMVGSRIMTPEDPDRIGSRGFTWNPWASRTTGVDKYAPATLVPDRLDVERRIDGPHGASFYVTRACVEKIGLMDETYFLYFEDLEWGLRAKAASGLGYAYKSVVPHLGGTTIGSAIKRSQRSELAVYLDFRNRLLFVRRTYPGWYPWTVAMVLVRSTEFLAVGSFRNFRAALAGWKAGLSGETGRPDRLMKRLYS